MATLRDWLRTIAAALNDDAPGNPFNRYLMKDLLAAYNAAMCLIAAHRPDLFTEWRVVQLAPGRYQDVRGCCKQVLDVIDQTDAEGNIIRKIEGARNKVSTVKRVWKKKSCLNRESADNGYLIENVDIDKNINGRFYVDPPVPCDTEVYVMVKCVEQPCSYNEAQANVELDQDCIYNVAAWHYVLAMMLSGDRFASAAGGDKQYHFRMFFDILGIVQQQEDRIESPQEAD